MNKSLLMLIILTLAITTACQPSPTPPAPIAPPQTPSQSPVPTSPPKAIVKEVELKYDDGEAKACVSTINSSVCTGYLVDFTPPSTPFYIKKVRLFGTLYDRVSETMTCEVSVWDKNKKVLYSTKYPVSKFPFTTNMGGATFRQEDGIWVDIDIPNIKVDDSFYVHIYTNARIYQGLHVGMDDSVPNKHSEVTLRDGDIDKVVVQWPYTGGSAKDKSQVNWMIRVVGTEATPVALPQTPISTPQAVPTPSPTNQIKFEYIGRYPGEEIQFVDKSQGTLNTWEWDFGDGSKSTQKDPKHVYTQQGVYQVSLNKTIQKVLVFEKNRIWLTEYGFQTPSSSIKAGEYYYTYFDCLIDGIPDENIIGAYVTYNGEGPFKCPTKKLFGSPSTITRIGVGQYTGNPNRYALKGYLTYKTEFTPEVKSNIVETAVDVKPK